MSPWFERTFAAAYKAVQARKLVSGLELDVVAIDYLRSEGKTFVFVVAASFDNRPVRFLVTPFEAGHVLDGFQSGCRGSWDGYDISYEIRCDWVDLHLEARLLEALDAVNVIRVGSHMGV